MSLGVKSSYTHFTLVLWLLEAGETRKISLLELERSWVMESFEL